MLKIVNSAILLLVGCQLISQTSKPTLTEATFSSQLSKIVLDFPSNFSGIQGNRIPAELDAETYLSTVCLPAALQCKVMRYRSVEDKSASWQAFLYEGESFQEALKLYKRIHGIIKKTTIKGPDGQMMNFEGQLENVDENVGFGVSPLRLRTNHPRFRKLVAELNINSNYTTWEVKLDMYERGRTEEENGNGQ